MKSQTQIRPPLVTPFITDEMEHRAEQIGMKIEYVSGLPIWEASPVYRHQKKVDQIRGSLALLPQEGDRKSTRLNSSHSTLSRMPSSA